MMGFQQSVCIIHSFYSFVWCSLVISFRFAFRLVRIEIHPFELQKVLVFIWIFIYQFDECFPCFIVKMKYIIVYRIEEEIATENKNHFHIEVMNSHLRVEYLIRTRASLIRIRLSIVTFR